MARGMADAFRDDWDPALVDALYPNAWVVRAMICPCRS
jgi:hypothetical protein